MAARHDQQHEDEPEQGRAVTGEAAQHVDETRHVLPPLGSMMPCAMSTSRFASMKIPPA